MQSALQPNADLISEVGSVHTSRRTSMLQRRKSSIAGRKVLYVPMSERIFIGLATVLQILILALLIAAAVTDVFQVDGTQAIASQANLTVVGEGLGVSITEGSKPFCYSLWGARKCGTTTFHSQKWYTERNIPYMGFPSPVTQTMMVGAAAFAVLAVCYSIINLFGIVIVVVMQGYTAVLCAWSFSVWITILISWALSVGVYSRGMVTRPNPNLPGGKLHLKDYCKLTTSFALTMTAFGLHAFQFAFTVAHTRLFEGRLKALIAEQKHLKDSTFNQPIDDEHH